MNFLLASQEVSVTGFHQSIFYSWLLFSLKKYFELKELFMFQMLRMLTNLDNNQSSYFYRKFFFTPTIQKTSYIIIKICYSIKPFVFV